MLARRTLLETSGKKSEAQSTLLKHVKIYLHQVHGALQMVDVDGVARLLDVIDVLADRMALGQLLAGPEQIDVIAGVLDAIQAYLDTVLASGVQTPLRLFPYYRALLTLKGEERINPADLFFLKSIASVDAADLASPVPVELIVDGVNGVTGITGIIGVIVLQPDHPPRKADLVALRKNFEKSLLAFLKQTDPALLHTSVKQMQGFIVEMWLDHANPRARSFWAVIHGFIELVAENRLYINQNTDKNDQPSQSIRQLFGTINLQIRRWVDGASPIPESLLREVLFFLARPAAGTIVLTPNAQKIYNAWQLAGQVPGDFETRTLAIIDPGILSMSKERLTHLKSVLGKIAEGEIALFGQFEQKMNDLADTFGTLKLPPLSSLLHELTTLTRQVGGSDLSEPVALEMATGLLFIESALDEISHLPTDFAQRAALLTTRLRSLVNGELPDESAPWLDDLSLKAQQRHTMKTLVNEMQSSLRFVEKMLDDYFRAPENKDGLSKIDPVMHQIAGALAILDMDDANLAMRHTQELIRHLADKADKADKTDQGGQENEPALNEKIAHNIGTLGFLIEVMQTQPTQLESAKIKFSFDAQSGYFKSYLIDALPPAPISNSNENEIIAQQTATPDSMNSPTEPAPADSDSAIDAELLEVFLMEAGEVLQCIDETIPRSHSEPGNQDHLITLRRSFHTLKGSSRMVGLAAFGNVAWNIEQVMNGWLADAKPGTEDLYLLLVKASEIACSWVNDLNAMGTSDCSGRALLESVERFKESGIYAYSLAVDEAVTAPIQATDHHIEPAENENHAGQRANVIDFPSGTPFVPVLEDDMKKIGDIEIALPLFNIYLAETDEIVRFLAQEFSEWRHEPHRAVTEQAVGAAHTLAGSSATVGYVALQEVAFALEKVLLQLEQRPVLLLPDEFDTLENGVVCIKGMLRQFALGEMASAKPEQVSVMDLLLTILSERALRSDVPVSSAAILDEPDIPSGEVNTDDIDADLLPIFLEEGNDLFPLIGETLRAWQVTPDNSGISQTLLRLLHTVKGSARMAGAMILGQQTHLMESQIEDFLQSGTPSSGDLDNLMARHDAAVNLFEQLKNPAGTTLTLPLAQAKPEPSGDIDQHWADTLKSARSAKSPLPETPDDNPLPNTTVVRVRADILDRLVNQAGEVSISRSRLENEVASLRSSMLELNENVSRLRDQLREVEIQAETQIASRMTLSGERGFDPLEFDRFTRLQELTRMMAESVNDVSAVQGSISKTVEGATDDLLSQARLTRELQQDLMRVRMVPFSSISERLYRITRQVSRELDKQVNLDIRGMSVEMDRSVLEKMAAPFEHMLRNAIVHGIESREQRRLSGKEEIGQIVIQVRQEGNEVVIYFNDDGRGLDLTRIREKAVHSGLLESGMEVDDAKAANLIFESGFSTATEVTELAGRGVGMDVVRSEASALGGRVSVESTPGSGSNFTIYLPLTLAVTQVVLLSCGGKTYAIPSVLVEQVRQLKAQALALAYNEGALVWSDQSVAIHYLSTVLADHDAKPVAQQYTPVIIIRSGEERVALHVDQIIGNREVVVKNIGPQLARMIGISGATVLGSGDIVLILNPLPLVQKMEHDMLHSPRYSLKKAEESQNEPIQPVMVSQSGDGPVQGLRRNPVVMVVDDSITVRKVTQRMLAREGFQVVMAKDGVDALQQLQVITPDLMLVDIEMPRMDGFDLTRNIRNDARLNTIPIIMITSRTADKHQNVAKDLGVNAYFGKPYQEEALLNAIAGFLPKVTERAV